MNVWMSCATLGASSRPLDLAATWAAVSAQQLALLLVGALGTGGHLTLILGRLQPADTTCGDGRIDLGR